MQNTKLILNLALETNYFHLIDLCFLSLKLVSILLLVKKTN